MLSKHQRGFALVESVIIVLVLAALVGAGVFVTNKHKQKADHSESSAQSGSSKPADTPLVLKSIGFNLDYYNPATSRAGDLEFTNVDHSLSGHFNQIWSDFGAQDYRSPDDPTKKNPQPTFVLPLHTKVHALVSGEVVDIKTLYSNDYTIWVSSSPSSAYIYETEHVDNPLVKKGDHVVGGQIIAEVSSKDTQQITPGFGLLEIGLLHPLPSGQATHLCLFKYLDPSIKDDIGKKITALHSSWETYLGKKVYPQSFVSPGCVTQDPVNG